MKTKSSLKKKMTKLTNLTSAKKKVLLFAGAFCVCPCPVHGTLLGLGLVGAQHLLDRKKSNGNRAKT